MQEYYIYTTGATSGAGTAYPSGATEFILIFIRVRFSRSLVLCVCFVDRCLSFYGFWPFCCRSFDLRILIILFGIFRLFVRE